MKTLYILSVSFILANQAFSEVVEPNAKSVDGSIFFHKGIDVYTSNLNKPSYEFVEHVQGKRGTAQPKNKVNAQGKKAPLPKKPAPQNLSSNPGNVKEENSSSVVHKPSPMPLENTEQDAFKQWILEKRKQLSSKESELDKKEKNLSSLEEEFLNKQQVLTERERLLSNKEQELNDKQKQLIELEQFLNVQGKDFTNIKQKLAAKEVELLEKELKCIEKEKLVISKEAELIMKEKLLLREKDKQSR